jgi:hypothetical protein
MIIIIFLSFIALLILGFWLSPVLTGGVLFFFAPGAFFEVILTKSVKDDPKMEM